MTADSLRVVVATRSPEATEALGRRLGARLRPGDVVALIGPLGSGKTILARGIALGCGAAGHIASPSFVVIRVYAGPIRVYHADLYRLERPEEIRDLGLEELPGGGVLIVEWADRANFMLPEEHVRIECALGSAPSDRVYALSLPASMADRLADAVGA